MKREENKRREGAREGGREGRTKGEREDWKEGGKKGCKKGRREMRKKEGRREGMREEGKEGEGMAGWRHLFLVEINEPFRHPFIISWDISCFKTSEKDTYSLLVTR